MFTLLRLVLLPILKLMGGSESRPMPMCLLRLKKKIGKAG